MRKKEAVFIGILISLCVVFLGVLAALIAFFFVLGVLQLPFEAICVATALWVMDAFIRMK